MRDRGAALYVSVAFEGRGMSSEGAKSDHQGQLACDDGCASLRPHYSSLTPRRRAQGALPQKKPGIDKPLFR